MKLHLSAGLLISANYVFVANGRDKGVLMPGWIPASNEMVVNSPP